MEMSSIAYFFKYDCMVCNIMSSQLPIVVSITIFNVPSNLMEIVVQKTITLLCTMFMCSLALIYNTYYFGGRPISQFNKYCVLSLKGH